MGISPSTHTLTYAYTVYLHAQIKQGMLAYCSAHECRCKCTHAADPHTHTHSETYTHFNCLPQLKTVTKDAVCQKRVPLSQNINTQHTTTSVLCSCFDLLQNPTHSGFFLISVSSKCVLFSLLSGPLFAHIFFLLLQSLVLRMKYSASL